jgi:hypothetical protein
MPQFDVHIYAVYRVKVCGVEADSPEAAAKYACDHTDLHTATPVEYAEEIQGFLVDTRDAEGQVVGISLDCDFQKRVDA